MSAHVVCEIPNQARCEEEQNNCQCDCAELQKPDTPPFGPVVAFEFLLQFLPRLFRRAFMEFGLVFLEEVE